MSIANKPIVIYPLDVLLFAYLCNYLVLYLFACGNHRLGVPLWGITLGIYLMVVFYKLRIVFYSLSWFSRFFIVSMACLFVLNLIRGFYINSFIGNENRLIYDIYHHVFIATGIVFVRVSEKELSRFLYGLSIVSMVVLLISLRYLPFVTVLDTLAGERVSYSGVGGVHALANLRFGFACFSVYLIVFSLTLVRKKMLVLLSVLLILAYTFLLLFYSKKAGIVQIGIMCLFFLIPYILVVKERSRGGARIKRYFIVMIMIAMLSVGVVGGTSKSMGVLWERLGGRFQKVELLYKNSALGEYDRMEEAMDFLKSASIWDVVLGVGLASREKLHLHIGYVNLVYKGGLVLLLITLLMFFNNFRKALKIKNSMARFFIWGMCIQPFFMLFHSPLYGHVPNLVFWGVSIFSYDIVRNFNVEGCRCWKIFFGSTAVLRLTPTTRREEIGAEKTYK